MFLLQDVVLFYIVQLLKPKFGKIPVINLINKLGSFESLRYLRYKLD